jgi:hypothetical protein
VAAVGAAMELRARLGLWKAAKSVALPCVGASKAGGHSPKDRSRGLDVGRIC